MSVYFIQCGESGPIKIGFTRGDAEARMADLQTAHHEKLRLLITVYGDSMRESDLHERFKEHRIRGEWFVPHPEILGFIDGVKMMLMIHHGGGHNRPEDPETLYAMDVVDEMRRMLARRAFVRFDALAKEKVDSADEHEQFYKHEKSAAASLAYRTVRAVDFALSTLDDEQIDAFEAEALKAIRDRRRARQMRAEAIAKRSDDLNPTICAE